ncbi:MAG TPA: glycosyltransferase family 87 protein [Candidatus Solibacter sp.]|nr:glycosyltransferase family 87 protein [Candidatus Solibacter sp.]
MAPDDGYHRRINSNSADLDRGPLISRRAALAGLTAIVVSLALLADTFVQRGSAGLYNDFYDYWLAAHVLAAGGNPYDTTALAAAAARAGLRYTLGTGYSYPVLFAYLCVPLTALSPGMAAWVFSVIGVAGLGISVALLAGSLDGLATRELFLLGAISGGLTPVTGSLYFGQANLLVLPLLALAYRAAWRPATLGLAAAVKLFPVAALAALAARGRDSIGTLAATAATALALIVLPNLVAGRSGAGEVSSLFGADPFWTNESINGFISRLSMKTEVTAPPLPGLPVVPIEFVLVGLLGLLVLIVILRAGGRPWSGCLALTLAYGVVAAPKNSIWNYTPLLLLVFFCWPRVRHSRPAMAILLGGLGLIELQSVIDYFRATIYSAPALTWLSSLALYGALALMALNAYLLLRAVPPDQTADGVVQANQALGATEELRRGQ